MSEKTHWKKFNNPDYLGAYAFQPGEEKTVTIKSVGREMVYNPSNSGKEECTVAHFEEDIKPLILNVTNCKTIAKVWGTPYIEDWAGHRITLKVKRINAFGELVDAVRVSADRPPEETYVCEACGKEIQPAAGKSAKSIAMITKTRYGKTLCIDCAKEEKNGGAA
ncbi:MAG: hypothetical protein J6I56_05975 [Lachnospiraceae bacterium]|nr:hypothetical protein [Lachnospiraceae bacterium]